MKAPRRIRLALAPVVTLGSLWMAALAAPTLVLACTCARLDNPDIAKAAENPDRVVFIGTVVAIDRPMEGQTTYSLGDMQVERVYKGTLPAVARVRDGGGGDCTMPLTIGQRMIWVAPYTDNVLEPGLCGVYGDTATVEGQQLIAAAVAAFGPGTVPGTASGQDPPAMPDDTDLAGFAIGLVGFLVLVIVVAVIASARQRSEEPPA